MTLAKWWLFFLMVSVAVGTIGVGLQCYANSRAKDLEVHHCRAVGSDHDLVIYVCDGGVYKIR